MFNHSFYLENHSCRSLGEFFVESFELLRDRLYRIVIGSLARDEVVDCQGILVVRCSRSSKIPSDDEDKENFEHEECQTLKFAGDRGVHGRSISLSDVRKWYFKHVVNKCRFEVMNALIDGNWSVVRTVGLEFHATVREESEQPSETKQHKRLIHMRI